MTKNRINKNLRELGYEPTKTKTTQPETPEKAQDRDLFQTPNYAVDLLVPFLSETDKYVWEPACGEGKIARRLRTFGFDVFCSDIRESEEVELIHNFLTDGVPRAIREALDFVTPIVITNPPFSLKEKFYRKCREFHAPFALLIPADYSGWLIKACAEEGAEKIIPTRRVDYITPSGLSGAGGHTADFHSLWLTWGFNLGRTETYVELSLREKKENI